MANIVVQNEVCV